MNILEINPLYFLLAWSFLFFVFWYARQNLPLFVSLLASLLLLLLLLSPNGKEAASWSSSLPDLKERVRCLPYSLPEALPWKTPERPEECRYRGRPL